SASTEAKNLLPAPGQRRLRPAGAAGSPVCAGTSTAASRRPSPRWKKHVGAFCELAGVSRPDPKLLAVTQQIPVDSGGLGPGPRVGRV
uniref:Uncharacterized protein n=1 Tax=Aquila chrysaetos chrysaetos TaxID=223781 RepID=A0A663EE19_AQUCH